MGNPLVAAVDLLSRKNTLFSGQERTELTAYSSRNQPQLLSLRRAHSVEPQRFPEHTGYLGFRAPGWGHLTFSEELSWKLRLSGPSCFLTLFLSLALSSQTPWTPHPRRTDQDSQTNPSRASHSQGLPSSEYVQITFQSKHCKCREEPEPHGLWVCDK